MVLRNFNGNLLRPATKPAGVPYIETDGLGSCMDLGFIPTVNMTYEVCIKPLLGGVWSKDGIEYTSVTFHHVMGANNAKSIAGRKFALTIAKNSSYIPRIASAKPTISIIEGDEVCKKHKIKWDGESMFLDDENIGSPSSPITDKPTVNMFLGCGNYQDVYNIPYYANARFYYAKFWEGEELVRNLIPYSGSRGIGMLDIENDVLYTNARGMGTLTYGIEEA